MKISNLSALTLLGAILAVPFVGAAATANYVVAVEKGTQSESAWAAVVDVLKAKHQAQVLVYEGNGNLTKLLPQLKALKPKYVCFVTKPETAGRDLVVNAAQLLRRIDDDPYGDAFWGIVTGYDAADALRLAKAPRTRVIRRAATSMGALTALDGWTAGFASDEGNKDNFWRKLPGQKTEKVPTNGNPAKALSDSFNSIDVDYFVTSGHATQRDWQIIYNKNEGSLRHDDKGCLRFMTPQGDVYPMTRASSKIYLAAGNCLIGNIDKRSCMATSWIHSGGVEQFCGYTCVTFFGFMGWGVKSHLEEARCSFAEAYYLQNQLLLWVISHKKNGELMTCEIPPEDFTDGRHVRDFIQRHVRELVKEQDGKPTLDHDSLGLLWDRDIVAFYGDPAERVTFPEERRSLVTQVKGADVTVTFKKKMDFGKLMDVKAARPVMILLEQPPAGTKLVDANGKPVADSVVNDRFLLIPLSGVHTAGETLRFRLVR